MVVSEDVIRKIARIARLELTDKEVREFTKQIDYVLESFKSLEKINTKDVKPSFQPIEIKNVWREDKIKDYEWDPFSNAENRKDNYFKGPRSV